MPERDAARIRLELDQRRAGAVHAALSEALNAGLLVGDRLAAAREVLAQLDARVPGWLDAAPVGGEAGYLVAADAVMRALVAAEDAGHRALTEPELLRALGSAKPLGATAGDVLERMRRDRFVAIARDRDELAVSALPPGRRFMHRKTAGEDDRWRVGDYRDLVDLIYAEREPSAVAHRRSVQAIGRLEDRELSGLAAALVGRALLEEPDQAAWLVTWLTLTRTGLALARERWRDSAPPGVVRLSFEYPPPPPLPYQRRLPLRVLHGDRVHPPSDPGMLCPPAAWLQRSSRTKLFATFVRDGAVDWRCSHCGRGWFVYLQAFTPEDRPAYADPSAGAYNRPIWCARSRM